MNNALIAMLFGLIGTVLFHLGKGMQKGGIGFIYTVRKFISRKMLGRLATPSELRSGLSYISGIVLNNSFIIWILLANKYAPPSYFTSVFGIGIIVLLIYARIVLKETIIVNNYIGMILIIFGTVILGVEATRRIEVSMADVNLPMLWMIIAGYICISFAFIVAMLKTSRLSLVGVSFGLFTGGAASLDPVLKSVAQNYGGIPGLVPSTMEGWIIFFLSFFFASASFLGTQWGFIKNSPASIQIPVGSSVYVCLPIIIQGAILPGFAITMVTIAGMLLVVGGILLLIGRGVFLSIEKRAEEVSP